MQLETIKFIDQIDAEHFCVNEHRTGNKRAVVTVDPYSSSKRPLVLNARKQEQQDHHVIRRQYVLHVAEMNSVGCYASPDAYYGAKDHERKLAARLAGTTVAKHDPMYFWHGGMSN